MFANIWLVIPTHLAVCIETVQYFSPIWMCAKMCVLHSAIRNPFYSSVHLDQCSSFLKKYIFCFFMFWQQHCHAEYLSPSISFTCENAFLIGCLLEYSFSTTIWYIIQTYLMSVYFPMWSFWAWFSKLDMQHIGKCTILNNKIVTKYSDVFSIPTSSFRSVSNYWLSDKLLPQWINVLAQWSRHPLYGWDIVHWWAEQTLNTKLRIVCFAIWHSNCQHSGMTLHCHKHRGLDSSVG